MVITTTWEQFKDIEGDFFSEGFYTYKKDCYVVYIITEDFTASFKTCPEGDDETDFVDNYKSGFYEVEEFKE